MCPTRNAQREPAWQGFAGGSKGPSVDKLSFNSWWSGPPRGQWSPLLKPLVRRRLSSLSPCWLHKAKVLCDHLQALLFCFVLSVSYSLLPFFSPLFSLLPAVDFGGDLGGDMIVSWLFCCAVSWGLAVVQLCLLFPGHIPISGTLKFLSLERARTMSGLMTAVGRWIALQAFVWQIQPVSIVHVLKKPYGGDQIDLALSI